MTRRKPKGEPYPPLRGYFPTAVGKHSEAETGPKASPSQWGGGPRSGSVGRFRSDLPEGDDGRTIVSMNVEGMPWYAPEAPGASRASGMQEEDVVLGPEGALLGHGDKAAEGLARVDRIEEKAFL